MVTIALALLSLLQNGSPSPGRILLNITDDPSRSAVITWRTTAVDSETVGQIALASPDPRFEKDAQTVQGTKTLVEGPPSQTVAYHTVRFDQLLPETEYAYRVGDGKVWSEWIHFSTASTTDKPFSFIYFGDAQNDVKSMWSRAIRRAFRHLPFASFMLHAGDLINRANRDEEWGEWFEAGGWVHATVPCVATPGNHEYEKSDGTATLSRLWKPQFAMPNNGPRGLEQTTYWFDYQGARFVSLNSNERIAEQATWLDKVLETNPKRWSFVTFHHPVYSTAKGRDNSEIRQLWGPILQKHKVAIVLQGHDHTYGRKNVPTGLSGTDPKSGTVYVVSVSGPKMYRTTPDVIRSMNRTAEYTQLFQIVRVEPAKVRFEAYTITGELYDAFELLKNRDGTNRFVDIKVSTPQRLEKDGQQAPGAGKKAA